MGVKLEKHTGSRRRYHTCLLRRRIEEEEDHRGVRGRFIALKIVVVIITRPPADGGGAHAWNVPIPIGTPGGFECWHYHVPIESLDLLGDPHDQHPKVR